MITPPSFKYLKDRKSLENCSDDRYKIITFAYDDEGNNGIALLDMLKEKVISYSLTGISEIELFNKLVTK